MQIINRFLKLLAISAIILFSVIGISNAYEVGDKITFGRYPFYEDGRKKDIDWIILDIDKKGNALVISDYVLDNVRYNEKDVDITWKKSTIRKWLNETFINNAFTSEQQGKIIKSYIKNNNNAESATKGGNNTYDKLFLLSIEEVNGYFNSDKARIAYPTPYAKSNKSVNGKLYVSDKYVSTDRGGSCWWWLRSPGDDQDDAAGVHFDGDIDSYSDCVDDDDDGVRPAFKINLNNFKSAKTNSVSTVATRTNTKTSDNAYKVGDIIEFGSYPFYWDGREKPIDWIILDIDADNNALVISDYALDNVRYYKKFDYSFGAKIKSITWEKSTIRKWLNGTFLNKAFTAKQRSKIITSRIYTTEGNVTVTNDKLFLLSVDEAIKYFDNNEASKAYPTPYAKSRKSVNGDLSVSGYYVSTDRGGSCWWWLRSPVGEFKDLVAYVSMSGIVRTNGNLVDFDSGAVRPALKINLNDLNQPKQNSVSAVATRTNKKTSDNAYKVGDKITFGSYPFYESGMEKAIDWIVLDIDANDNALLISDYALDNVKYNEKKVPITWEDSTIRKWLNNDFINNAFTEEQRSKIINSYIDNKYSSGWWSSIGGNDTNDKLFLLNTEEADKYFRSEESRIAYPTPYAKSKKSVNGNLSVFNSHASLDRGGSCDWWLRSPSDYHQDRAASVIFDGEAHDSSDVDEDSIAVRPALKINLKNLPKAGSLKKTDTSMEKNYYDKENTQKVDILALRKGFHSDRTRIVFDISDACVWEETRFSDSFFK